MLPRPGEPTVDRLEAVLAENAGLRMQLEALDAERRRLQREIRRAGGGAGGGGLLNGALHDFKNLLTVISGHTDLLLKRLQQPDPLWRSADAIRKAAESGTALTQDLLRGGRRAAPAVETIDVNALVEDVERLVEGTIRARVALVTRLDACDARVPGDRAQLQQVVVNLAVNALDATPDGGCVTLQTTDVVVPAGRGIALGEPAPGAYVVITVSDTGTGMEPWVKARLFEPYFTTKAGKGTGLGLATTQQIVERHGGTIAVVSSAGHGSTFRVYLPRLLAASGPVDIAGGAPASEPTRETILIVEDEPEVLELLREILEGQGYHVLEAPDMDRAVEIASRHAGAIHLVITDIVVPGMGVWDFRTAVARWRPAPRLLYISGHTEDEIERRLGRIPGPILKKPFAVGALADKVRELLDAS